MSLIVYGASDDLIEFEGDLRDEFGYYSDEPAVLAFSDGTLARVVYDQEGIWRFTVIRTGALFTAAKPYVGGGAVTEGAFNRESDVLEFGTGIEWVALTKQHAIKSRPA